MREAVDLDDALEITRQLSRTLDMPQRPDAFTISDTDGLNLYLGVIDTETANKEGYHHERP